MIKAELPKIAEMMLEVNRVFGKPKMVIVQVGNQTIFDSRVCNRS